MLSKAMAEGSKLINIFTLEPSLKSKCTEENCDIKRQRLNYRLNQHDSTLNSTSGDKYFYFRLFVNKNTLKVFVNTIKQKCGMNIRFHDNRSTFLSQHLALYYIKEHQLVNCLINHEFYGQKMLEKPVNFHNYPF